MNAITPKSIVERFNRAKERRSTWESHWDECYDYALPQRGGTGAFAQDGGKRTDRLFDGTAPDAVDQLAASLLAQLTPPWTRWFGLVPGAGTEAADRNALAPKLEKAAIALQTHFDHSNFAVEIHQCYMDLVTIGTASLLFEEGPVGEPSAFRFTAVPVAQIVLEEGASGRLDTSFRRSELTLARFRDRFPKAELPDHTVERLDKDPDARVTVIEAVVPDDGGYAYLAVVESEPLSVGEPRVLAQGKFEVSPFINFRWLKAPGEQYGRSPVMKALPDIKTANKVVELVLKNASIAVTGIWQADDDGVLNPANIKLVPGTIIPKAVGSAGLTPLDAPGRFDVSQLVLDPLRERIRKSLLVDQLGQVAGPTMTATEVLQRASEMARVLGATYGRLQSELLTPLMRRAVAILVRRGEIPADLRIDGHYIDLQYKSPLARFQAQQEAQGIMQWVGGLGALGPTALASVDQAAAVRWLGRAFGVPGELIREIPDTGAEPGGGDIAGLMAALGGAEVPDAAE